MPKSKKLLIRLSSAGDVLLTSPLLRLMKGREPDSEIHFVVKSQYADLIRLNPNVNEIHLVQDQPTVHALEETRLKLAAQKFDMTLDLHNNFRSVYLRRGTSRDIRVIKKDIFKRALLVNTKLNLYSSVRSVAMKYAQTFDRTITSVPRPEIFLPQECVSKADEMWSSLGPEPGRAIFLCPGARHFTKRWPAAYWSELAARLAVNSRIVLLGGQGNSESFSEILDNPNVADFCGRLSLMESTAMMRHASVVITNDSYLMHAANALGKKVVAIFGSSVREFGFFPYGVDLKVLEVTGLTCRPCSHVGLGSCPRRHFRCMMETIPPLVEQAALSLLNN